MWTDVSEEHHLHLQGGKSRPFAYGLRGALSRKMATFSKSIIWWSLKGVGNTDLPLSGVNFILCSVWCLHSVLQLFSFAEPSVRGHRQFDSLKPVEYRTFSLILATCLQRIVSEIWTKALFKAVMGSSHFVIRSVCFVFTGCCGFYVCFCVLCGHLSVGTRLCWLTVPFAASNEQNARFFRGRFVAWTEPTSHCC
jgi:hypothetical protein